MNEIFFFGKIYSKSFVKGLFFPLSREDSMKDHYGVFWIQKEPHREFNQLSFYQQNVQKAIRYFTVIDADNSLGLIEKKKDWVIMESQLSLVFNNQIWNTNIRVDLQEKKLWNLKEIFNSSEVEFEYFKCIRSITESYTQCLQAFEFAWCRRIFIHVCFSLINEDNSKALLQEKGTLEKNRQCHGNEVNMNEC
jgi:hypothetical protein